MAGPRVVKIEFATLTGQRPRAAGCNARLSIHGQEVKVPLVRITTEDGASGFGPCRTTARDAEALLNRRPEELLPPGDAIAPWAAAFEFPLWDLAGQRADKPVYELVAEQKGKAVSRPFRVPCYDTSLYIDDLHLQDDEAAANLIADEARFGFEANHRAFKIKVGRGARHMPVAQGTQRDIAVIKGVRNAVGPNARLMIDANNGYTLNLAKRVLSETAECRVYWLEEAFHEDGVLYGDLHAWLDREGLSVLIADGEGEASPSLMEWARTGIVDVIQYDIFSHGFCNWLQTGAQLDAWQVRTAPHHYGRHLGNYISGHLAAAIENFTFVEWDEVTTPGINAAAYRVEEGLVVIPDAPGFGLELEAERFLHARDKAGFILEASGH